VAADGPRRFGFPKPSPNFPKPGQIAQKKIKEDPLIFLSASSLLYALRPPQAIFSFLAVYGK
jgi:hypothetical protein